MEANNGDTKAEYGSSVQIEPILSGAVKPQPNAQHFVRTITRFFVIAKNWHTMTPPKKPSKK